MKIKGLLIGMLACTAMLVGCNNEDESVVDNNGNKENKAYMSVKLIMAESSGSRAAVDNGYDEGVVQEQLIKGANSIFLFYDEDYKWVTSGELIDEPNLSDGTDDQSHDHTVTTKNDKVGQAYVVLSSPEDLTQTIKHVLTVVNYSNPASLKNLDLDDVVEKIAEAEKEKTYGFLMTTSVYADASNKIIRTTAINGNQHIKNTQEAAKNAPVEIFIERAAAKVQLSYINGNTTTLITEPLTTPIEVEGSEAGIGDEAGGQDGNDITINGKQYPAYITIEGWTVNNVNLSTYLVKNVDENWNTTTPLVNNMAWSNKDDYRSYWAKGTKYATTFNEVNSGLKVFTYEDATKFENITNDAMYCYEQTIATPTNTTALKGIDNPTVTTVLIAAKIKVHDNTTGTIRDAGTLYQYGGVYFTETEYKKDIMNLLQGVYYTKTGDDTKADLTSSDITLEIQSDGESLAGIKFKVTISESVTVYTSTTTDGTTTETSVDGDKIAEFINNRDRVTKVEAYKEGACYYQIPIEHLSSQTDDKETYLYGVVRNHWYKLNISKIIRIGEAVYDPTKEIPQIPEQGQDYYMAARLHVLNWHVVEQDVTLD